MLSPGITIGIFQQRSPGTILMVALSDQNTDVCGLRVNTIAFVTEFLSTLVKVPFTDLKVGLAAQCQIFSDQVALLMPALEHGSKRVSKIAWDEASDKAAGAKVSVLSSIAKLKAMLMCNRPSMAHEHNKHHTQCLSKPFARDYLLPTTYYVLPTTDHNYNYHDYYYYY